MRSSPSPAVRVLVAVAIHLGACKAEDQKPAPVASAELPASASVAAAVSAPVPAPTEQPGSDPQKPALAPEDRAFTDARHGWGWADRCWKNLHAGLLGYARAECNAGLAIAAKGGGNDSARPSLLYNVGLIEEKSDNLIEARRFFEESIALRQNDEVATALKRVGGTPPPPCETCASQEDFDAVMKKGPGAKCCPVMGCQGDADCSGGRVCCKIPGGQLCGDAERCVGSNRVGR